MLRHELYYRPENVNDPLQIAELQRTAGTELANLYATSSLYSIARNSAEVVLRNPTVYLQDPSHNQLPEELQSGWSNLQDLSAAVVKLAAPEDKGWSADDLGIKRLQSLLYAGNLKSCHRLIADVMEMASRLFAESIKAVPGNSDYTPYYDGNVKVMQNLLIRSKQSQENN